MKRLPFHRNQNIMKRYPYHNDTMFLIYHKNSDLTFLFQLNNQLLDKTEQRNNL